MKKYVLTMLAWVLVSTQSMTIPNPDKKLNSDPDTITVPSGTVVNIITYDGNSTYSPPISTKLKQTTSDIQIGDEGQ